MIIRTGFFSVLGLVRVDFGLNFTGSVVLVLGVLSEDLV